VVQRAGKLIETAHFGQALELLDGFTEGFPESEWTGPAKDEKERLVKTATRRYKDVKADVQRYKSLGKLDDARAFLDHVIRYYGLPELVEDAKEEREALDKPTPPAGEGKEPAKRPETGEPGAAEKPEGAAEEPEEETKTPHQTLTPAEGTEPRVLRDPGDVETPNAKEKLPDAGETKPSEPTKPAVEKPAEDTPAE